MNSRPCRGGRDDFECAPLRSAHIQRNDYFYFAFVALCGALQTLFSQEGSLPEAAGANLTVLALSVFAPQIHLSQRERPWHGGTVPGSSAKCPFAPEASSQRELAKPTALPEGVKSSHAKKPPHTGCRGFGTAFYLRFASRLSIFFRGSMMLETDISWFRATTK